MRRRIRNLLKRTFLVLFKAMERLGLHVGCAPDLVDGKCGLVFPHDRPEALVAALRRMAGDEELRSRCAERARAVIAAWSVDEYMAGLRRALGLPSEPAA